MYLKSTSEDWCNVFIKDMIKWNVFLLSLSDLIYLNLYLLFVILKKVDNIADNEFKFYSKVNT